eukprot:6197168-Pleurochrysis_carterae.AAC.1
MCAATLLRKAKTSVLFTECIAGPFPSNRRHVSLWCPSVNLDSLRTSRLLTTDRRCLVALYLLTVHDFVDEGIKHDAANANRAAQELDRIEAASGESMAILAF